MARLTRLARLLVLAGVVAVAIGLVGGGHLARRSGRSSISEVRELGLERELRFNGDVVEGGWVMTTYTSDRPAAQVEAIVRKRLRSAGYEFVDEPETLTAYAFEGGIAPAGFPPEGALDYGTHLAARRAGDGPGLRVMVGNGTPTWVEVLPER